MKAPVTHSVYLMCAIAFCFCLGALAQEKDVLKEVAADHASLAAYPQAVISVKDSKTGMIFYVESNGRRVVAFDQDAGVVWSVDVLTKAMVKPTQGQPVIRNLRLQEGKLCLTCGKHDHANVDIKTGKAVFVGAD